MATPTDTKEEPKKVQKTSTKQLTSFLSSLRSLNPFTPPSSTPTSRLFSRLPHPTTILFIGLEGSGKTTLLRDYLSPRPENVEKVYHSDGIRVENLQVGSALFQGYDTGTCRPPTWHEFEEQLFARADGVVYMVDAADRDGIMESREELIMHGLRADDGGMREGIPLLVLATKVDLMVSGSLRSLIYLLALLSKGDRMREGRIRSRRTSLRIFLRRLESGLL